MACPDVGACVRPHRANTPCTSTAARICTSSMRRVALVDPSPAPVLTCPCGLLTLRPAVASIVRQISCTYRHSPLNVMLLTCTGAEGVQGNDEDRKAHCSSNPTPLHRVDGDDQGRRKRLHRDTAAHGRVRTTALFLNLLYSNGLCCGGCCREYAPFGSRRSSTGGQQQQLLRLSARSLLLATVASRRATASTSNRGIRFINFSIVPSAVAERGGYEGQLPQPGLTRCLWPCRRFVDEATGHCSRELDVSGFASAAWPRPGNKEGQVFTGILQVRCRVAARPTAGFTASRGKGSAVELQAVAARPEHTC